MYGHLKCLTLEMSTPVIDLTKSGTLLTMESTSSVSLAAPISPPPVDTMVIFLACDNGAATSAAIWKISNFQIVINRELIDFLCDRGDGK